MIVAKGSLTGNLVNKQSIQGIINKATEYIRPTTQVKIITPTKQIQEVLPDENIDLLSKVTVNAIPDDYIIPEGQKEITENGMSDVTQYESVNVNVPIPTPNLQNKLITITENQTQIIVADAEYDGLNEVEIITNVGGENEYNTKIDTNSSYDASIGLRSLITKCENLDVSKRNTLNNFFDSCINLKNIPQLNTTNVLSMSGLFKNCKSLTTIPQMDTSNVKDMSSMFQNCISLTTIPQIDTSNVQNMNCMFNGCNLLTTIPQLNTGSVTIMSDMFRQCINLVNIPQLNTRNLYNMNGMFYMCQKLKSIPQIITNNVTSMYQTFYACVELENVPVLNTSKVTNLTQAFYYCQSLTDESINNILTMCININTSFRGIKKLTTLGFASSWCPASRIQALSNYQAFLDAGWTIGY